MVATRSTIDGGNEVNYGCHWSNEHEENNEIDQNTQHQRSCSPDAMGGRQGDDYETILGHYLPNDQSIHSFLHDNVVDLAAAVSALSRLTECGSLVCITESMPWVLLPWGKGGREREREFTRILSYFDFYSYFLFFFLARERGKRRRERERE